MNSIGESANVQFVFDGWLSQPVLIDLRDFALGRTSSFIFDPEKRANAHLWVCPTPSLKHVIDSRSSSKRAI